MRKVRRLKDKFTAAIVFMVIMSATILAMPLVSNADAYYDIGVIIVGAVFWTSLIFSYLFVISAASLQKNIEKGEKRGCVGMFRFFSNKPACVVDTVCIISLLLFIISGFTQWRNDFSAYIIFFFFTLSLNLHCMFNGRIYRTITKNMRRDSNEKDGK